MEVKVVQIEPWATSHNVCDYLRHSLLLNWVTDVLVDLHVHLGE
jgi:hypothetical protein